MMQFCIKRKKSFPQSRLLHGYMRTFITHAMRNFIMQFYLWLKKGKRNKTIKRDYNIDDLYQLLICQRF